MKRLAIVADSAFVAQAMRLGLRQTVGFREVAVIDGRASVAMRLTELKADVVLVGEMEEPERTLSCLREIASSLPASRSLLLTTRMDDGWLGRVFDAGAHAVISRSVHPVSLGTLLREIAAQNVVQRYTPVRESKEATAPCSLTPRELEILCLAARVTPTAASHASSS